MERPWDGATGWEYDFNPPLTRNEFLYQCPTPLQHRLVRR